MHPSQKMASFIFIASLVALTASPQPFNQTMGANLSNSRDYKPTPTFSHCELAEGRIVRSGRPRKHLGGPSLIVAVVLPLPAAAAGEDKMADKMAAFHPSKWPPPTKSPKKTPFFSSLLLPRVRESVVRHLHCFTGQINCAARCRATRLPMGEPRLQRQNPGRVVL